MSTSQPSSPSENAAPALRIAAIVLRTIFILTLILVTTIVSLPQNETIWTIYDTPLDAVRVLLGVAVCIWLIFQLFRGPRDAQGYRTWVYLGLAAIPFAVICLVAIW